MCYLLNLNVDYPVITVTLAMIGKLAITASYGTVYIFSTEQFPTVIRNAGLGAGSTSARIGSVFAPMINITVNFYNYFKSISVISNYYFRASIGRHYL